MRAGIGCFCLYFGGSVQAKSYVLCPMRASHYVSFLDDVHTTLLICAGADAAFFWPALLA